MMIDRLRVRLGSSSRYDPPDRWYRAVYWVPAGYACARVVGEGTPVLVVGCWPWRRPGCTGPSPAWSRWRPGVPA